MCVRKRQFGYYSIIIIATTIKITLIIISSSSTTTITTTKPIRGAIRGRASLRPIIIVD